MKSKSAFQKNHVMPIQKYELIIQTTINQLKKNYKQPDLAHNKEWEIGIARMNTVSSDGYPPILGCYLVKQYKIDHDDIEFLNTLLENGLDLTLLQLFASSMIADGCAKKNKLYCDWLLDACHFNLVYQSEEKFSFRGLWEEPSSDFSSYFLGKFPNISRDNDTALIFAARCGDVSLFKHLVQHGHDINASNSKGINALCLAIRANHVALVDYILEQDVNLLAQTDYGLTVFHESILHDKINLFCKILKKHEKHGGGLSDLEDSSGDSFVHWAIEHQFSQFVPLLLTRIAPTILDPIGLNLVLYALLHNQHELAVSLVDNYKLDIRATSARGFNALHYCILSKNTQSFKWLLDEHCFDVNACGPTGDTPLVMALQSGASDIVSYLLFDSTNKDRLDVQAVNTSGFPVYNYLVEYNQHEAISLLLKQNRLDLGMTYAMLDLALLMSEGDSHYNVVTVCIQHIRQYVKKNKNGVFPSWKDSVQYPAILRFFCVDSLNLFGPWIEDCHAPLHLACLTESRDLIEDLVVSYTLDVEQQNGRFQRPMYLMIKHRTFDDSLWFYNTFKAKITHLDGLGSSLLQVACELENIEWVRWCVKNKQLSSLKPRLDGRCALDLAIGQESHEIVSCLWGALSDSQQRDYIKKAAEKDVDYLMFHGYFQLELDCQNTLTTEEHSTPSELGIISSDSPLFFRPESTTPSRCIYEKKSALSPTAAEWVGMPVCYTKNDELRAIMDKMSDLFNKLSFHDDLNKPPFDVYFYGSANYKINPSDLDILVPNIRSAEDYTRVNALIDLFISQGGVVTTCNKFTGEYGYRKSNRHIIPMTWEGVKLEFSVSEKSPSEHARILDFTVGAMYFSLRYLKRYSIDGIASFSDINSREIRTIADSNISFAEDLSRIFRAVRLVTEQGFFLSSECVSAIKELFQVNNPFITRMNRDKLYQQLELLFDSERSIDQIIYLKELGVFEPLYYCLSQSNDPNGRYYEEKIRAYCVPIMPESHARPTYFIESPYAFYAHSHPGLGDRQCKKEEDLPTWTLDKKT
ncbi:MAG: ankyrin repeat domain-containing protein [Legionellaceae bacterium]|nr:ankyrin repeat domain-containing protein [Legionellaceae bacterium]